MQFLRSPHVLLTITALLWAGNAIAGKYALGHISPMVLTLGRWTLALGVIGFIGYNHIKHDWPTIRHNWLYLLLLGGFGYTGFNFALYSALQYTSAINVTIEQTSMPLLIFIFNFVLYRIGIKWLQMLGYALTVIGVVITATYGQPWALFSQGIGGINRGDLIILIGCLFYAGYSVGLRKRPEMHWQSFLASLIAGGVVFAAIGLLYEAWMGNIQWPTTIQGFLPVIYAGIFPSLVSQGFFMTGVAALGANRAGLYINMVPVFAAILSVLLLDEKLYLYHATAFVLVVGGVLIAQRATR